MKIQLISALTVVALAAGIGATEAKSKDAKKSAEKPAKAAKVVRTADSKSMVEISKGNLTELKLSEVAQSQATNAQVKSFAQQMIDAHTQMGNELSTLASSKGVSLPSSLDATAQRTLDKLKATTGATFDKTFMTDLVAGHKKVLSLLRSLAAKTKDADVKKLAEGALPTVTKHLDMATSINSSLSKTASK